MKRRCEQVQAPVGRQAGESLAFRPALGKRLLDDHVLAVLEREARELRVRGGWCEDDDDLDVRFDDLARVGDELRPRAAP